MKIGVVCNHHFGLNAINYLAANKLIVGIAVPGINMQLIMQLKQFSESGGISLITVTKETLQDDLKNWLESIHADAVFVFSFPFRIPETLLNIPKHGFINFHPSPLPLYRGPDPLFWQIKNGETSTGITAHQMNKNFDRGPVLFFESETITPNETYGFLESKLSFTLIRAVIGLLNLLQNNTPIPLVEQKEKDVSYFTRPTEKDLIIYWQNQNAVSVCNLVRACNPKFQGVVTSIRGTPLRILQVTLTGEKLESPTPGTILNDSTGNLKVVCADNNVLIIDIVYIQEGCFSGKVFKEIFNIQNGEVFV